jgi:hypothetical protein
VPRAKSRDDLLVPPAVRHYLLTGKFDYRIDGKWRLFEALYGPLGASRDDLANWDADAALESYRAALRVGRFLPLSRTSGRATAIGDLKSEE